MELKQLETNTFLFSFQHEVDLFKVFHKRPWSIRGGHLILKKWSPELAWKEVVFSVSTFWVQVHGLPSLWLSKANLWKIGSMIGVIKVNFTRDGGGAWKKFIRIRVDKPIDSPFLPGFFLPRTNNDDLWVCLRYEKLSEICFHCGVIGHLEKFCKSGLFQLRNHAGIMFNTAGPWLRVESNETPLGLLHLHPLSQSPMPASVVEQVPSSLPFIGRAIITGQGTSSPTCSHTCHPYTTPVLPAQSIIPEIVDSTTKENTISTTELVPLQVAPDVHVDPDSPALSSITRILSFQPLSKSKLGLQWTYPLLTHPHLVLVHPSPTYHHKPNPKPPLTPSHRQNLFPKSIPYPRYHRHPFPSNPKSYLSHNITSPPHHTINPKYLFIHHQLVKKEAFNTRTFCYHQVTQ